MNRRRLPLVVGASVVLWVLMLAMLAVATRNSEEFGRLQPWILLANAVAVLVLMVLLIGRFAELFRERRRMIPGSRLRSQTVLILSSLALAPLLVLFAFSVLFLTRGIDSWFHLEVRQGLTDAMGLSRAALDLRMTEFLTRTERIAEDLEYRSEGELYRLLADHRRLADADDLVLFGPGGQVLASASAGPIEAGLPTIPGEILNGARGGEPFVSLEPAASGGYEIRSAVPLGTLDSLQAQRVLMAVYPVPQRLADLATAVQSAYQQYGRLSYLREPLKLSFVMTLSLVLLMALLAAVYGAFFFTDRLVQPLQDLIGATRAVAKGDFDTRVVGTSRDEVGYLVASFNAMTARLARARAETESSRQEVESERAGLAAILARLSTGVLSLEADLTLRLANQAAGEILGADLTAHVGESLEGIASTHPLVGQFLAAIKPQLEGSERDWREQFTLRGEGTRRELICACTMLPGEGDRPGIRVLVFDDLTQLLKVQREAAWGEVARRLAHEIKNPLTPIQLSAERVRRRLLGNLPERDAEVLERATHTIVQQVEAMKQMVNAFSEYARAPAIELESCDLNALVREAADLYHAQDPRVDIRVPVDSRSVTVLADRGRLRQVLNNLLTNSLEALESTAEPRIVVETHHLQGPPGGGFVELTVRDNGPGFQPELMDRLFDPYVTSKSKGTGLGLAIVRKIVEEHGGRIEADNEGEGARIRVWLPVDEAARGAGLPRSARRQESRREYA
ncbi:MAG: ATP-binding protein [Steroidobacteraceae bacterium]